MSTELVTVTPKLFERFLSVDKLIGKDEACTLIRSTTELDTIDMVEYTDKCRTFAEEYLLCYIPEPNEQLELPER